MNNHIYTFGGELRVQQGNGSIGDRTTCAVAQIVMRWWDKKFKEKLSHLKIIYDIIKRYMDDINGVFNVIKPGTELKGDKLIVNEERIESDKEIDDEERTMELIKNVANSIDSMIKMTVDFPENYEDRKVPMLDVQLWLNTEENPKIYYIFYQKPMRNRLMLLKNSLMSQNQKLSILTQGVFRRIHNTKPEADENMKVKILDLFMEDLRHSGFNEKERLKILTGGFRT